MTLIKIITSILITLILAPIAYWCIASGNPVASETGLAVIMINVVTVVAIGEIEE